MEGNKIDAFTRFIEEWLEMQEKVVQENIPVPNRVFVDTPLVNALKYGNIPKYVYGIEGIPIDPFQMVGGTPRLTHSTTSECGRSVPQYDDPAGGGK